jgi:FkbM family methyltransferase
MHLQTVVDVGANVGQFSLLAVGLHPSVQVHAFEPLEKPSAVFERLFSGRNNVTLHRFAIGNAEQPAVMAVSRRHDSSSLLKATPAQIDRFPGTDQVSVEVVSVATLDAVMSTAEILSPALLKLDVQGYELFALQGCEKMLPLFAFIYLEISFAEFYSGQASASDLFSYLIAREFHLSGVYNVVYGKDGIALQCDCLFRRNTLREDAEAAPIKPRIRRQTST